MRWFGPLVPFAIGVVLLSLAWREQRHAAGGRRSFPYMSVPDLLAGPFALGLYGLAFVGTACALWVAG